MTCGEKGGAAGPDVAIKMSKERWIRLHLAKQALACLLVMPGRRISFPSLYLSSLFLHIYLCQYHTLDLENSP